MGLKAFSVLFPEWIRQFTVEKINFCNIINSICWFKTCTELITSGGRSFLFDVSLMYQGHETNTFPFLIKMAKFWKVFFWSLQIEIKVKLKSGSEFAESLGPELATARIVHICVKSAAKNTIHFNCWFWPKMLGCFLMKLSFGIPSPCPASPLNHDSLRISKIYTKI